MIIVIVNALNKCTAGERASAYQEYDMRFFSIASGSSGNCIYAGSESTHLLIDAGISKKRIIDGLNGAGIDGDDIDAIFVTHEHGDHIKGLGVMARKYRIPMYASQKTIDYIVGSGSCGEIDPGLFVPVLADESVSVGDMEVMPFRISHDAVDPLSYSITNNGKKISVVTDLGEYDDYILSHIKKSDILFVEANHDVRMLQTGRYPYSLKQRILGKKGHLSNETCGRMILESLHGGLKQVILGHLSRENNYDRLALETVKLELAASRGTKLANAFPIDVAKYDKPGEVYSA